MKNYQYVLDIETPFIRKLYDKEDNYKVELLTPYGILEELKKLQEENADLEAKLAESESCVGMLHHHLTDKAIEIEMLGEEIDELKQQLAEKEHELDIRTFEAEMNAITITKMRESKHQDKISFAVEQLNNILNLIEEEINSQRKTMQPFDNDKIIDLVFRQLNKQIKQLKEKK